MDQNERAKIVEARKTMRQITNKLRDLYTVERMFSAGDDEEATARIVEFLELSVAGGELKPERMIEIIAFMARRLSYTQANLRGVISQDRPILN